MLTIFRRHLKACRFTTREDRACQCPISVEGTLQGRMIRKSTGLRSWEAAQKLVREWEANPQATLTLSLPVVLSEVEQRMGLEPFQKIPFPSIEEMCSTAARSGQGRALCGAADP